MTKCKYLCMISFVAATVMFLWSCDDYESGGQVHVPHDPGKPVVITGFEPDSGGLATTVFITGSNFGSDVSKIKVYFNQTRTSVIGSNGSNLYVKAPPRPGRDNVISIVVGNDSVVFSDKTFLYREMFVVRTIAGRKGTTEFRAGTLQTAEFDTPSTLTIDADNNIFLSHWAYPYCFVRINEAENVVVAVEPGSRDQWAKHALGAPTVDSRGVVSAISDQAGFFFTFDPEEGWESRERPILPAATAPAVQRSGTHSLAAHPVTGDLYYSPHSSGQLVRLDPVTRVPEVIRETITSTDRFLVWDPVNTNILYLVFMQFNCIYKWDMDTDEFEVFAGEHSTTGDHQDGRIENARFNRPRQMIVAPDGHLYIADSGNHCIRRILLNNDGTPSTVETVIGRPGVAGYEDGNAEDALFDSPRGVAVAADGTIYIADFENNVVRKLTFE